MSMLTGQSDKLRKAALIQEEHVHYNMALADDTILSLRYRVRELRAENAKLRELASGLHQCLDDEGCEGCPMQDDDGWCVRDIRLRELGVEAEQ